MAERFRYGSPGGFNAGLAFQAASTTHDGIAMQIRLIKATSIFAFFVCLSFAAFYDSASGQELRKTIRDYRTDQTFHYAPSDPWLRSKFFNIHTGNYGRFYNFDGEQAKRNSPYIFWQCHFEKDFPTRRGLRGNLLRDIDAVRTRIADGLGLTK